MDYYLDKTVSVGSSVCRQDGRPTSVVEVTLKNTAPADAATSLPRYVTGGGDFGTEPGKIKTLVAVYAPENAIYLGSTQDGKQVGVQTATDGGHPVTQLQTLLAPGRARPSASRTSATRSSRTPVSRRSRRRASSRARSSPCGSSARTRSPRAEREPYVRDPPRSGGDGVSSRAARSELSPEWGVRNFPEHAAQPVPGAASGLALDANVPYSPQLGFSLTGAVSCRSVWPELSSMRTGTGSISKKFRIRWQQPEDSR